MTESEIIQKLKKEEIERLTKTNLLWEELYDKVVQERNEYKDRTERLQRYVSELEESVRYLTNQVAKGV